MKKRKMKKHFSAVLAAALVVSSLLGEGTVLTAKADTVESQTAGTLLTQEDVDRLTGEVSVERTSVHDPSVIADGNGSYYIFGSHLGISKTSDLANWTSVTSESTTSTLFGNANGEVVSYADAFTQNAYTGPVTVLDADGNSYEVDFGSYDVAAWISDNTVQGNMWAPDVIYNPTMGKWCMYLSLNGATWNSSVVLLTADSIDGTYVYQGPVVFSGFSTTDSSKSFKNTDLELVIGEQDELPEKYQKIADSSWGTYWPHAIDPAVFYDAEGNLWLAYGSWSGGIYMLELDESTGLRDYTVTYEDTFAELGASVTSDPYFGTKIAGGYYVSGEGSYIEQIGNYYYLFMSYGFYSPDGGYNMRVFQSETPDGPYVDANGNSAIFTKYIMNYSNSNSSNNIGMKLMGNYKWDTMDVAEVAQGHNSAFVDADGKAYVVYHTKFADGTASHEVRVHQLFVNEDGWLVAAPYEYSGETISATGYSVEEVAGSYGMITHDFQIDYANLAYKTAENITLNADGTISGAHSGTWSMTEGTPYAQLVIDGMTYKGVFTKQTIDGSNIETMCFTVVSQDGLSIWGSGEPSDDAVVAQNAVSSNIVLPENTYADLTLVTEGLNGAEISWSSSNTAVLSNDGKITIPAEDTVVTLTETISKGDYYFEKDYQVTVKATVQNDTDAIVVGTYFSDETVDLSQYLDGSLSVANPFYYGTNNGMDLSGGVTIEFDANATGDVHVLGTIFSILSGGGAGGRLYFTPGSYLGYNAAGSYFDANLNNYSLVTDYIGSTAHVAIEITTEGFTVTVNDEVAYTEEILTTENGAGTVSDYEDVLDWLYGSADTLYFGYGSWWNAAGYDEANINLSNVVCTVGPLTEKAPEVTDTVAYTKEEVVLATTSDLTVEENPFYGKNIDNFYAEYTINMTEGTAQNGWDGIFSFYNSATGGRVSFQTAPYVCFNNGSGKWMDLNNPGGTGATDLAPSMTAGTEHVVAISITSDGAVFTVDGEEIAFSVDRSGADYETLIDYITQCDQLTWGVGTAQTAYWNTEMCTLTNITFSSEGGVVDDGNKGDEDDNGDEEETPVTNPVIRADSVTFTANTDITYQENPFEDADFDAVTVSYTINFSEDAVRTGWDGLFSFYNSATGGRVSFQSAPYVCYNDNSGKWIDINQPDGTAGTSTITEYGLVAGVDYDVTIIITRDAVEMYLGGVQIAITENGSGATYEDLLTFIGTCDKFSFGVGGAESAYWYTELCTLTDVEITSHAPATEVATKDDFTIENTTDCEVTENPYYHKELDSLSLTYTINWSETAAKNGWDGIFSFYNSTTGGRVSFQSAPYICFNDNNGSWIDINQPGAGGTNAATDLGIAAGEDVAVTIDITADEVKMTVNGEELAIAENGSGATYEDILAFISECDQLTFGVGEAQTAYWWSELCTVSDFTMIPVTVTAETDGNGTAIVSGTGSSVTVSAVPAKNYEFVGWYADSVLIGTESAMDINVCEDVVVKACFNKLPAKIETSYKTITSWGNYVTGALTITNVSEETLKSWSIQYDYEGDVLTLWGAGLDSKEDGVVCVSAPKWNKNLKADASVTFYFIARIADKENVPEPQNVILTSEEQVEAESIQYSVSLKKVSEWPKGYVGSIAIENTGDVLIDEWTVEFDYEDDITSVWGGSIVSRDGSHYVITNAGYNSEIAGGQTMIFGFMGVPADGADTSSAELSNVKLSSVVK